jgi:hypothetical protein
MDAPPVLALPRVLEEPLPESSPAFAAYSFASGLDAYMGRAVLASSFGGFGGEEYAGIVTGYFEPLLEVQTSSGPVLVNMGAFHVRETSGSRSVGKYRNPLPALQGNAVVAALMPAATYSLRGNSLVAPRSGNRQGRGLDALLPEAIELGTPVESCSASPVPAQFVPRHREFGLGRGLANISSAEGGVSAHSYAAERDIVAVAGVLSDFADTALLLERATGITRGEYLGLRSGTLGKSNLPQRYAPTLLSLSNVAVLYGTR